MTQFKVTVWTHAFPRSSGREYTQGRSKGGGFKQLREEYQAAALRDCPGPIKGREARRALAPLEEPSPFLDSVLRPDTHCFHSPLVLQSEDERLEALEDEEEKENGGDPEEKGEAESPRCEEKDS